jgi:hypothetical protein
MSLDPHARGCTVKTTNKDKWNYADPTAPHTDVTSQGNLFSE